MYYCGNFRLGWLIFIGIFTFGCSGMQHSLKWLSLASVDLGEGGVIPQGPQTCDATPGLNKKQRALCRRRPDLMPFIVYGATMSVKECQHQFENSRWNCTVIDPESGNMKSKNLHIGTRETAFVHALTSAAVSHSITKACSHGRLPGRCSCDQTFKQRMRQEAVLRRRRAQMRRRAARRLTRNNPDVFDESYPANPLQPSDFDGDDDIDPWFETLADEQEQGSTHDVAQNVFSSTGYQPSTTFCSDNVAYGTAESKRWVDAREKIGRGLAKKPERERLARIRKVLVNLHNNQAGRQVVVDSMKTECKCMGVSGSCDVKTCWRTLAPFRSIGQAIRDKFQGATEVEVSKLNEQYVMSPKSVNRRRHTKSDLVFLHPSPDFCESDEKHGSMGTRGRACNRTSHGADGCGQMCCGRQFRTVRRVENRKCACKFVWCCKVECQQCRVTIEESVCL